MGALLQDLRYGLRALWKSPGFSIPALTTLALGIGATAVLFSILDGAYIHFGQTEQANRAILLTQKFTKLNSDSFRFSPAEYFDIKDLHGSFDGFFALRHFNPTLTELEGQAGNPERVPAIRATANIFQLYGISPIIGRGFTPAEDQPGGNNVVVVTYRLWEQRFGRNPAIMGRSSNLTEPHTPSSESRRDDSNNGERTFWSPYSWTLPPATAQSVS